MTPARYDTARRACRAAASRYRRSNGALCRQDDLEAAAMFRIVEAAERFRPRWNEGRAWEAWCRTVARGGVIDYIRSVRQTRGGHTHRVVTDSEHRVDTDGPSALGLAADPAPLPDLAADHQIILDALARLPESDARVVSLYYLAGYNDREIAARTPRTYACGPSTGRTTVSAAAIHSRRRTALLKLKRILT